MAVHIRLLRDKIPFKELSDKHLKALSDVAFTTEHQQDELLFNIGDTDNYTAYLIKGWVSLERIDGRVKYLCHDQPEADFGLANLKPRLYKVRVVENQSIILWLKSTVIDQCLLNNHRYNESQVEGFCVNHRIM